MNTQPSKSSILFRLISSLLALCLSLLLTWSVRGLHTPVIYDYGLTLVFVLACLGLIHAFLKERRMPPSSEECGTTARWLALIFGIALGAVYFLHDGLHVQV